MNILFIPGIGGSAQFWQPAGDLLPKSWTKTYVNWPGAGNEAPHPAVNSYDDYANHLAAKLIKPSAIVAQSLGGTIAVRLAHRYPDRISHLVLAATSGGIDAARFRASQWQPAFRANFPNMSDWLLAPEADQSPLLRTLSMPVLLLWADADPISPVGIGRYLQSLIANADLHVLKGDDHSFGSTRAPEVAALIEGFLTARTG